MASLIRGEVDRLHPCMVYREVRCIHWDLGHFANGRRFALFHAD